VRFKGVIFNSFGLGVLCILLGRDEFFLEEDCGDWWEGRGVSTENGTMGDDDPLASLKASIPGFAFEEKVEEVK